MSVESKARRSRRAKQFNAAPRHHATTHVPAKPEEKRAAGAIIGALLTAITFGTLESGPPSSSSPAS